MSTSSVSSRAGKSIFTLEWLKVMSKLMQAKARPTGKSLRSITNESYFFDDCNGTFNEGRRQSKMVRRARSPLTASKQRRRAVEWLAARNITA